MKIPVIFLGLALFLSTCSVATNSQERSVLDILPLDVWGEIQAQITDRKTIRSLELLLRINFPSKSSNDAFEHALKHVDRVRFDQLLNEDTFMFDEAPSVLGDKRNSPHVRSATNLFNLVGHYNPRNGKKVQVLTISDLHNVDKEVLKVAGEKVVWKTVKHVKATPLATLDKVPWSSMKSLHQLTFHSENAMRDNMPFVSPAALEKVANLTEITCDSDRLEDPLDGRDFEVFLVCLKFAANIRSESLVLKTSFYDPDKTRAAARAFSGNTLLKRLTVTRFTKLVRDILRYLPPDQLLELEGPFDASLTRPEIDKLKKLQYLSIDTWIAPRPLSQLTTLKRLKMKFLILLDGILSLTVAISKLQQLTWYSLEIYSDSPALKNAAFWHTLQHLPLLETIEIQLREHDGTDTLLYDPHGFLSFVSSALFKFNGPIPENEVFVFKRRIPF